MFRSESDEPVKVERYCNGHPCVGVGASSCLEWRFGGDGGPSVPDQALLDAQVPGGSAPALNDQGCQCVVSWRLGVSNVMTSRDAGWVGFPEGEVLSALLEGAISGLSEFAFEVDVPRGCFGYCNKRSFRQRR